MAMERKSVCPSEPGTCGSQYSLVYMYKIYIYIYIMKFRVWPKSRSIILVISDHRNLGSRSSRGFGLTADQFWQIEVSLQKTAEPRRARQPRASSALTLQLGAVLPDLVGAGEGGLEAEPAAVRFLRRCASGPKGRFFIALTHQCRRSCNKNPPIIASADFCWLNLLRKYYVLKLTIAYIVTFRD